MKLVFASLLCLCGIVAAVPIPQDEDLPPMPVVNDFNMLDNELGEAFNDAFLGHRLKQWVGGGNNHSLISMFKLQIWPF